MSGDVRGEWRLVKITSRRLSMPERVNAMWRILAGQRLVSRMHVQGPKGEDVYLDDFFIGIEEHDG